MGGPPVDRQGHAQLHRQEGAAPRLLRDLFGLTASEALVAIEVGRGTGVNATARTLSIATGTAHTHLARVFAKTGTSRQAELAHLLARLAP